jgi:uncharacterized repeat protein (TIGR01451 family)
MRLRASARIGSIAALVHLYEPIAYASTRIQYDAEIVSFEPDPPQHAVRRHVETSDLTAPLTLQLRYRGGPLELACCMLRPPRKIESIGLLPVRVQAYRLIHEGGSMRSVHMVLATALGMALLTGGVAVADTVTTNFDGFNLGTVNGQDGWHSAVPGNVPALPNGYDQAVVSSGGVAGFGARSLRHSNAYSENTGEFEFQTYSRSNAVNAGEALPNTEFVGEFQFTSTSDELQDQLHMRMSPDDGHGGRMSFVGLRDTAAGIQATIFDTPEADGDFMSYPAGIYSRDAVHTVRFLLQLVPGPDNDIVHIVIDGVDIGNMLGVCLTTWENFYRATNQAVPVTNSLQFRSANAGGDPGLVIPNLVGHGYLFDNVSTDTTPAIGAVPTVCGEEPPPIDVDKTTQTRSALRGQLITYRISVRNRGDALVRGLRACDRAPRALRFVRATTRLRRAAGGRLCLTTGLLRPGQRETFRATFRLRENATAESVTNGASVDIPAGSAATPLPPNGSAPLPPDSTVIPRSRQRRVARDAATIKVRTVLPRFTG